MSNILMFGMYEGMVLGKYGCSYGFVCGCRLHVWPGIMLDVVVALMLMW